ncbi:MAG: hypothetical protein WCR52_15020 [Bacteroidota bacterium]|uniref:hypothetical protein n=1 Tax=Runella sp. TaxID=1960881 RepID=UPI00301B6144
MKKVQPNTNMPDSKTRTGANLDPEGYPIYPADEDIYNRSEQDPDIDPEDISKIKYSNDQDTFDTNNEKDFDDDISGGDLDVPGSELDNDMENIGEEDEENNYYSLGGDSHLDLEEDQGDQGDIY